jgi:uncharacterized protein with GYD domain
MAFYLLQWAFTPEAWAARRRDPEKIDIPALPPVVEQLGGRLVNAWLAFGEYDVIVVVDMPDNERAAALSVAISAGGAVRAIRTTPLLTIDEGRATLRRAGQAGSWPPGS